jgi:hypothetical protein
MCRPGALFANARGVKLHLVNDPNPDLPLCAALERALVDANFMQPSRIDRISDPQRKPIPMRRTAPCKLAAPIHRQWCFSEILVRGDFGCGSSFGFFAA